MSNSNQVQTWRFGRTRALFVTQKLLNRAKNRGAERRSEFFSCVQFNFFRVYKTQLEHNNCKIKSILSGLVTRRLYLLKKNDTKQPKFPPCRNWPICILWCNLDQNLYRILHWNFPSSAAKCITALFHKLLHPVPRVWIKFTAPSSNEK